MTAPLPPSVMMAVPTPSDRKIGAAAFAASIEVILGWPESTAASSSLAIIMSHSENISASKSLAMGNNGAVFTIVVTNYRDEH